MLLRVAIRIGRTGRLGQPGTAVTLFTAADGPRAHGIAQALRGSQQGVPAWLAAMESAAVATQHSALSAQHSAQTHRQQQQQQQRMQGALSATRFATVSDAAKPAALARWQNILGDVWAQQLRGTRTRQQRAPVRSEADAWEAAFDDDEQEAEAASAFAQGSAATPGAAMEAVSGQAAGTAQASEAAGGTTAIHNDVRHRRRRQRRPDHAQRDQPQQTASNLSYTRGMATGTGAPRRFHTGSPDPHQVENEQQDELTPSASKKGAAASLRQASLYSLFAEDEEANAKQQP